MVMGGFFKRVSGLSGIAGNFPNAFVQGLQMFVHLFVDLVVEGIVHLVGLWIGFKYLPHPCHGLYGRFKAVMKTETHGRINGRTQTGSFIYMRFSGRQTKDIGCELKGIATLGAATGYTQAIDGRPAAFFYPLFPFTHGIGQSFDDSPIKMGPGMDIPEPDNGPLGFGPR